MKQLKPIVRVGIFVAIFIFLPFWACKGQGIESDILLDTQTILEKNYNSILDVVDSDICAIYEDEKRTKCSQTIPVKKYLYITDKPVQFEENEDIFAITKNTRTFTIDDQRRIRIYGSDAFVDTESGWYETGIGYATPETWDKTVSASLTFLDDWNPFKIYRVEAQTVYSNSADGAVRNYKPNNTLQEVHDQADGDYHDDTSDNNYIQVYKSGTRHDIWRSYFCFDVYAIDCTADTLTFGFTTYTANYYDEDNDGKDYIRLFETFPADPTALVLTDYTINVEVGDTPISNPMDISSIATNTAYELAATSTVFDNNDPYTCVGLRLGNDYEVHDLGDNLTNGIGFYTSEYSGTANDPYLEITCSESPPEEPTATTTTSCIPDNLNDLAFITACSFASSTGITYTNYHFPFLVWIILAVPLLWIGQRIIIEFVIRWRGIAKYK